MSDTLGNDHPYSPCSARDRFVHDSTFARSGHAEHVIDLLVRRGRLADSDSHPIELVRPDGGNYRLKTFVPTGAPLPAYTYGADGQVYVVCNDDQPFRIGPIPGQQVLRRFAAQVYIRARREPGPRSGRRSLLPGPHETPVLKDRACFLHEPVDTPVTGIVPSVSILRTRVPETHYDPRVFDSRILRRSPASETACPAAT